MVICMAVRISVTEDVRKNFLLNSIRPNFWGILLGVQKALFGTLTKSYLFRPAPPEFNAQ